jgi:hypothetical protein
METIVTFTDKETGVVVVIKDDNCFSIHLGNEAFELEMSKKELKADYVIPKPFDKRVAKKVSDAIKKFGKN